MQLVMNRISPLHILMIGVAIAAGAVIDRTFVRQSDAPKQPAISAQQPIEASSPVQDEAPAAAAPLSSANPSTDTTTATKKTLTAILAERDPRQRTSDLEAFINGLGSSDFADALKRIRKVAGTNERELASRLLVARWVQTDPEAALAFATSNRGFEYVAEDVFQAEAASDAQAALSRAREIPDSDLRYMALRGVLSFIADTDPGAALLLAQSLGDFPGNEPLSSVIYRQWATIDPQSAALQAAQDSGGGNYWQSPTAQVARSWAAQDPAAAANWALSLTDPQTEARTISQVMRQWARDDITGASNWVNALPPGASYDAAAAALAYSMAPNDPQSAVAWADNISDTTARTNALTRVSREVMWHDPTNGMAVLQAAGVPPNLIPQPSQVGRGGR